MAGPESSLGRPEEEFIEEEETPKFGANVTIRSFWGRHAQKMSGEVTNAENTGLSYSSISPKGQVDSRSFGENIDALRDGAKPYSSDSLRTQETLDNILLGYQDNNPDAPVRGLRVKEELTMSYPPTFLKLYDDKFVAERAKVMQARGLDPAAFKTLDANLQQEIAEEAEEPVIREWLKTDSELNMLCPPELCASKFAKIFNNHSARMATYLASGSEIDLFHNTHKARMEPFWISGVLIRNRDGRRIENLDDLGGGSAAILEHWQSVVTTDEDGLSRIAVNLRGEDYIIDRERLLALVEADKKNESLETDLKARVYAISKELGKDPASVSTEDLMLFVCQYLRLTDPSRNVSWRRGFEERDKFRTLTEPNSNTVFHELKRRIEQGLDLDEIIEQCAINSDNPAVAKIIAIAVEIRPDLPEKILARIEEFQNDPETIRNFVPPVNDPRDLNMFRKWGYDGRPEEGGRRSLRVRALVANILDSRLSSFSRSEIDPSYVPATVLKNEAGFVLRYNLGTDKTLLDEMGISYGASGFNNEDGANPIAAFDKSVQPLLLVAIRSLEDYQDLLSEISKEFPETFNNRYTAKLNRVAKKINFEREKHRKRYPGTKKPSLYDGFDLSSGLNYYSPIAGNEGDFEKLRLAPYYWKKQKADDEDRISAKRVDARL